MPTGRLVTDLTQEDFEVRDNGKPQPITVFSKEIQPITLVMMLDRSGSMKGNFRLVDQSARGVRQRLLPHDKAKIGSFAEKMQLDPEEFTSDRKALIKILRTELQQDRADAALERDERRDQRAEGPGRAPRRPALHRRRRQSRELPPNNIAFMDVMRRAQEAT